MYVIEFQIVDLSEAEVQECNAEGSLCLHKKVSAKIVPNVYSVMFISKERLSNFDHMVSGLVIIVW